MTKNQPKIILNIQFENEELDKQIQIAMDKYDCSQWRYQRL